MPPSPAIAPPFLFQPRKRIGLFISSLNLRLGFMQFIAVGNGLIFLSLVWAMFGPITALGPLTPFVEDMGVPHENSIGLIALVFFIDICQRRRRMPPTYGTLTSLSGQAVIALISLFYVITGRLSPIALYATGGVFFLSFLGMVIVIQSYETKRRFFDARKLMYPALSLLMGGLALGLVWPGSATLDFIEGEYSGLVALALIGLLAWGCGQLKQNHLTPDQVTMRIGGMMFFAFFTVARFVQDPTTSLLGTCLSVMVWVLAMFYAFIQGKDYNAPSSQDAAG